MESYVPVTLMTLMFLMFTFFEIRRGRDFKDLKGDLEEQFEDIKTKIAELDRRVFELAVALRPHIDEAQSTSDATANTESQPANA